MARAAFPQGKLDMHMREELGAIDEEVESELLAFQQVRTFLSYLPSSIHELPPRGPVTDDPTAPRERHFTARLDNTLVRSIDDVKGLIDSKREQIVDARAAARFRGEAPEPRAGLRSGHMPTAFNLPYNELLDPKTNTMLPADKLAARIGQDQE